MRLVSEEKKYAAWSSYYRAAEAKGLTPMTYVRFCDLLDKGESAVVGFLVKRFRRG